MSARRGPIRLATRRSPLALAQSRQVARDLVAGGHAVELVEVTTQGDLDRAPLTRIGGTGVFVTAVREAVLEGRADIAVHSLKDLPTAAAPGLRIAAVPVREDPRDALVCAHPGGLAGLPRAARVGTGSPRRQAQLAAIRPDLELVGIRGNVDSRVARVLSAHGPADLDAVVVAVAGLTRLGRREVASDPLDVGVMTPAPGQGALAVEARSDADEVLDDALRALDHPDTRAAVTAERAVLTALGSGCSAPVGAIGRIEAATLHLHAVLADPAGSLVRSSMTGPIDRAESLGSSLARLLADAVNSTDLSRGSAHA